MQNNSETELQADIISIQKISIIPTLLDVICKTTGMGFAAVARVTENRWITCSLQDNINFGLKPGDELRVETTICHEIRQTGIPVVIDHVDESEFCNHHTPDMYGFQSYISVPVIRKDGRFFGTLCAIDPKPAKLNTPGVIGMFNLFSDLIAFHLNVVEQLEISETNLLKEREERTIALEQKNTELQKMNAELEAFAYIASHDLQEPLRKIETFSSLILNKDYHTLSDSGKNYFDRLSKSVVRMQTLIRDLIMYTQVKVNQQVFEETSLNKIVEDVTEDFSEEINQKKATIEVSDLGTAYIIPFQFNQLFQNLIGNSLKFSRSDVKPVIHISSVIENGNRHISKKLKPEKQYCHITITDNGIGFEPAYNEKVFEVFQRLNGKEEYSGTGIGLSIVKKIVDNHHGVIIAQGELNEGARFEIFIPQR